jgi:predicted dehydrogenase
VQDHEKPDRGDSATNQDSIKVAVIGVGHLGYHHARLYKDMSDVELACVVDIDGGRAKEVADEFGTKWSTKLDEIPQDVVAASIAVPTSDHFQVAGKCIEKGLDVLVEKPLTATLDEGQKLSEQADSAGRILQVGHVERFNGAVRELASLVKDPLFIEAHRMAPYSSRGDDVGVVLDLMIHDLDIMLALVDSPVTALHAVGVPVFSKAEDIANVRIIFESGCVANLTVSRISVGPMRKIRIFQRDCYISVDYEGQDIKVFRRTTDNVPPGVSPMETISIEMPKIDRTEPLQIELKSFINSVRTRQAPEVGGKEACNALELAHKITDNLRTTWKML